VGGCKGKVFEIELEGDIISYTHRCILDIHIVPLYNENMDSDLNITVSEPVEIQTGAGLWKIEVRVRDREKYAEYEIYSYKHLIADALKITGYPTANHVKNYAKAEFLKWYGEAGNTLPIQKARIFTSQGGMDLTDYPEKFLHLPQQVRTNINIPQDLYDWSKKKAFNEEISLSELIRLALSTMREQREETEKWFITRKEQVISRLQEEHFFPAFMEITHYLPENSQKWDQTKLLEIARASEIKHTGWPIGIAIQGNSGSPRATEDGVEAEYISNYIHRSYDYWYLTSSGNYYFARSFDEDTSEQVKPGTFLWFDIRIRRIAEAIEHAILLYKNLGISDEEAVRLKISLFGIGDRQLSAWDPGRAVSLHPRSSASTIKQIGWEKEITYKVLKEKQDDFIYDAVRQMLIIFNFFEPAKQVVDTIVKDYRSNNF
jgi:hypothetical protein